MSGNPVVLDRSDVITPTNRNQELRRFSTDGFSAQSKKSMSDIEIFHQPRLGNRQERLPVSKPSAENQTSGEENHETKQPKHANAGKIASSVDFPILLE
jgi:hypothetical protein